VAEAFGLKKAYLEKYFELITAFSTGFIIQDAQYFRRLLNYLSD
jgi:hypothetical protein